MAIKKISNKAKPLNLKEDICQETMENLSLGIDSIKNKIDTQPEHVKDKMYKYISNLVLEELTPKSQGKLEYQLKKEMDLVAEAADSIIIENLFNPELCVNFVAKKLYVSVSYLYRCSIHKYKISISEYINQKKLETACDLISEGKLTLSQISTALNYCSQSYFSTCFKKRYSLTPLQYKHYANKQNKLF